ncbi:MAG: TATA-box-binding protein [Candidatus Bathyarchaeota archaeon]|nr:TATA-box-binding protein [Candidatus Bathyarchaeota archaeon]
MPLVKPVVKIENVVACSALKHGIDLSAVVKAFPVVVYRPKRFPGLVFKLKKPRTTILIFSTGKMVCTGAKSERDAVRALRNVVKTLNKGGMIIRGKLEIEITNVVATTSLDGTVDLLQLYESERSMGGRITYEPDQFPGLIYRMSDPKVVILLFASGKLVCTGARKEGDVHQAVDNLRQKLEKNDLIYFENGF